MPMRFQAVLPLIVALLCAPVVLAKAEAEEADEASWTVATEEPSLGELFAAYAADQSIKDGIAFAFPPKFRFKADAIKDRNGTVRVDQVFGIDLSRYQGLSFPIASLRAQEVRFVYTKATQGTRIKDESFARNWSELQKTSNRAEPDRVYRGAYHFLSADDGDGASQADRFVAYVKLHGGFQANDLAPALDVEWDRACVDCPDRWAKYSAVQIIEKVKEFRDRLNAIIGTTPLIYSNKSFLNGVGIANPQQIADLLGGEKAWIFDLNSKDTKLELPNPAKNLDHRLWQFSWSSYVPGHAGDVDVDVFLGNDESFKDALVRFH